MTSHGHGERRHSMSQTNLTVTRPPRALPSIVFDCIDFLRLLTHLADAKMEEIAPEYDVVVLGTGTLAPLAAPPCCLDTDGQQA